jgi:hypothetical protein
MNVYSLVETPIKYELLLNDSVRIRYLLNDFRICVSRFLGINFMLPKLFKLSKTSTLLFAAIGFGLSLGIMGVLMPYYFVLVGIAGILYVIVAWLWPEIALLGVLCFTSTIFDIYALPSVPIGVGNLIISDILIFVLIGIIFLRVIYHSSLYIIHTPIDMPLLAFYGTAILTTVIGIYNSRVTFNQSLGEVRAVNFYLIFFIVTNLVRNEKQLRRLFKGIIFLALFVAVAMIVQYVLGPSVPILPGRVETLDTGGTTSYGVTRILPPGQSLVMPGFVCLVVQMLFDKKSPRFGIHMIQLGIIGLAVLLTFNRSFWTAITLALLLVGLLVSIRDKIMYFQIAFWTVLIGIFVIAPFASVKGGKVAKLVDGITVRMSTLFNPDTVQEDSLLYRYVENEYAFPVIASHPFWGLGLGAYYRPFDHRLDYGSAVGSSYVHNGHLYIMIKTGLIGYFFFVWFLLLFVKRGLQNWGRSPELLPKGIVLSFTAVVIGTLVAGFVNPIFMQPYWTTVIGTMLGVSEVILRIDNSQIMNKPRLK